MQHRPREVLVWLVNCPAVPLAACAGFWWLLSWYCSKWNALLVKVAKAKEIEAGGHDFFAKAEVFADPETPSVITIVGVWLGFYTVKFVLVTSLKSGWAALLWYLTLLSAAVVYCYLYVEDWDNAHVSVKGNWLGTPIMFLTIPTVTFLWDLLDMPTWRMYLIRSVAEVPLTLMWTWIWVLMSCGMGLMWL